MDAALYCSKSLAVPLEPADVVQATGDVEGDVGLVEEIGEPS